MQQLGRYQVLDPIARGGMGVVVRARDPATEQVVAIKLLSHLTQPTARKRFQREAEALARVEHPHVVRLHAVGTAAEDRPYLVMELVEGESLEAKLARGPLPPHEALEWTRQLCDAVAACHAAGVLHRDLKPENLLITPGGLLKLTDFGLARDTDPSTSRSQLTEEGVFLGTPGYWAPEQAHGQLGQVDARTDVYGVGATLFALLTGRPPHAGADLMAMLADLQQPKPPPSSLSPEVPAWLDRVVLRALAVDPQERYPSVAALAQALATQGEGEARGGRRVAVGLLLVLAAGGVGLALAARAAGPSPAPPPTTAAPEAQAQQLERLDRFRWLHRSGAYEEARALLAPQVVSEPRTALEWLVRAEWRYARNDLAVGDDVHRALALDPDLLPALILRARVERHQDRLSDAEATCTQLVEVAPDSPDVLAEVALVLAAQGGMLSAWEGCLVRARQHARPEQVPYLDCVEACAWLELPDYERAFALVERARQAWPHSGEVWWLRAKILTGLRRMDSVLASAERATELYPDAWAYLRLARLYVLTGQDEKARRPLERTLELDPDSAPGNVLLAGLEVADGDYATALARLDTALEQGEALRYEEDQDFAYAYRALARVELGDEAGSRRDLEALGERVGQLPKRLRKALEARFGDE